eukprot:1670937-Lingulodinium_polyedra.AAC.1
MSVSDARPRTKSATTPTPRRDAGAQPIPSAPSLDSRRSKRRQKHGAPSGHNIASIGAPARAHRAAASVRES